MAVATGRVVVRVVPDRRRGRARAGGGGRSEVRVRERLEAGDGSGASAGGRGGRRGRWCRQGKVSAAAGACRFLTEGVGRRRALGWC